MRCHKEDRGENQAGCTPRRWGLDVRFASLGMALAAVIAMTWIVVRNGATPRDTKAVSHSEPAGPPWIYGQPGARFTIIEYADIECPYCRDYFPILKKWIAARTDVNWQWHHLPLTAQSAGYPQRARFAECVGAVNGNDAFWNAIEQAYRRTSMQPQPTPSTAITECLASTRPDAAIRAQADSATADQVTATPTLRLVDHESGRTLVLQGPVEGDALLSALDLLVAAQTAPPDSTP